MTKEKRPVRASGATGTTQNSLALKIVRLVTRNVSISIPSIVKEFHIWLGMIEHDDLVDGTTCGRWLEGLVKRHYAKEFQDFLVIYGNRLSGDLEEKIIVEKREENLLARQAVAEAKLEKAPCTCRACKCGNEDTDVLPVEVAGESVMFEVD